MTDNNSLNKEMLIAFDCFQVNITAGVDIEYINTRVEHRSITVLASTTVLFYTVYQYHLYFFFIIFINETRQKSFRRFISSSKYYNSKVEMTGKKGSFVCARTRQHCAVTRNSVKFKKIASYSLFAFSCIVHKS